jgi:hypothetical protein
MTRKSLPVAKKRLPIGGRQEIGDARKDVRYRVWSQGDTTVLNVNPEADDFERRAVGLLFVIKGTGNKFPTGCRSPYFEIQMASGQFSCEGVKGCNLNKEYQKN